MHKKPATGPLIAEPPVPPLTVQPQVNQTQALNCTKILVPSHHQNSSETKNSEEIQAHQNHFSTPRGLDNMNMDYGIGDFSVPYSLDSNFMIFGRNDCQVCDNVNREDGYNLSTTSKDCLWFGEPMLEDRTGNDFLQPNASFDLGSLFRFLDSDELK
ncbi:hypothetical protein HHK36_025427 [Tetracentron sinense]|uniref:Uncharacterized protein n=1 Tax=Tetracentron sinense TaxID=13715 RepID=A0A834YML3_TETSI|nr:hypothetical protein HHK36_025427 [Tetracentron sinense]